jgi:hypothetical protein
MNKMCENYSWSSRGRRKEKEEEEKREEEEEGISMVLPGSNFLCKKVSKQVKYL